MTVINSLVTQSLQNMMLNYKKLRYKKAAARTDVARKCKLQASFFCSTDMLLHLFDPLKALVLCNSLTIILMFFSCIQKVVK